MLDSIRRWWSARGAAKPFPELARWAEGKRLALRAKPEGDALIVDSDAAGERWRLEWGPSQRPYIEGAELRLRAQLGGGDALHLLVLTRRLMQTLEADIFEQYTEDLQTRADSAAPDEMRWLVLYPKLASSQLGVLRDHFGAVGHPAGALATWVGGPLNAALADAVTSWLDPDDAFVLVVQRGRLTMRTPLARPEPARIDAALTTFRVALREAKAVLEQQARAAGTAATPPAAAAGPAGGTPG